MAQPEVADKCVAACLKIEIRIGQARAACTI